MLVTETSPKGWTTATLETLPDAPWNRYEIIDGELFVTRAPDWKHQKTCLKIGMALATWIETDGSGEVVPAPGVLFSDADNVIPDVVWASDETLSEYLDDRGHLTSAPELIVEVLSPGQGNRERDRNRKLNLYSKQGVSEYWICDWRAGTIEVYRRRDNTLQLAEILARDDEVQTPLLPGFCAQVSNLLA